MPAPGSSPALARPMPAAVPRLPLMAMAALVVVALAAATAVRLSGITITPPDAPAVQTRTLQFADRPDGGISVVDMASHQQVTVITGEQGFVRGTLRGLARERRRLGIGPEAPLLLIARADGRLTLQDPATGRRVDLESFGPTNEAAFARLLGPRSNTP